MKTLISLFWESTKSIRFLMMLVSALGALGLAMRSQSPAGDTSMMFHLHPWWAWSGALITVSSERWWCLWMSEECGAVCVDAKSAIATCILATYVWVMMLISSAHSADFGLAVMMTVCVGCEFWLLARIFAERRTK